MLNLKLKTRGLRVAASSRLQHLVQHHPLMLITLCFLSGIGVCYKTTPSASGVNIALSLSLLTLWLVRQTRARVVVTGLVVFAAGCLTATRDLQGRQHETGYFTEQAQIFICQTGSRITTKPLRGNAARRTFQAKRLELVNESLRVKHLPVTINWYGPATTDTIPIPAPDEIWQFKGRSKVRRNRQGLVEVSITAGSRDSIKIADARDVSWGTRVNATRKNATQRVSIGIAEWEAVPQLIQAMLLGSRHEMPRTMRRIFADSGTIHVFAISGLHIAFVTGLLIMVARASGIQRRYWGVFVVPMLVFYTVVTGASPSAVRATIMAVIYMLAPLCNRRSNAVTALSATALIVHALRPWLLYNAGNILSFTVMGGLLAFCQPFSVKLRQICGLAKIDERLCFAKASSSRRQIRTWHFLRSVVLFYADSFAVSLAAWLASVPLTAYYFGRFTPGGLAANLVVVPSAFLIVTAGFLGMATSFISTNIAACFNNAAGFFTMIMIKTAEFTARCPGGTFVIKRWNLWMVTGWFVILSFWAFWIHTKSDQSGLEWLKEEEQTG